MPIRFCIGFLVLFFIQTSLDGQNILSKKLNFSCENCLPAEALVRLSRQADVNISFNPQILESCPPVFLKTENETISHFLNEILDGSGAKSNDCNRLTFRQLDNQIVVFRKTQKLRLAGYVQDSETGEQLLGAVVKILPDGKIGTTTNEFGFFTLVLDEGNFDIAVSYIGYETIRKEIDLTENQTHRIYLKPKSALPEVVISASNLQDSAHFSAGKKELPLDLLRKLTMPGGEADVIRLAALQTGVQTGVDGLGGLHVRGGNADQNLVLLDDVPVYNPSHALGLLSVFNPGIVSKVDFWKGNFPARFGGRASSVLDVRTRDGNLKKYKGKIGTGLLASTFQFEGPVARDTSSFLAAARFSYFDPWIKAFSKRKNLLTIPQANEVLYRFYDVNLKFTKIYSPKDRVYFSFYIGNDNFQDRFEQQFFYANGTFEDVYSLGSKWGNTIFAARWNHLFSRRLFSNTTLTFSRFFYENRIEFSSRFVGLAGKTETLNDVAQLYKTLIRDFSGKTDFTFYLNNKTTFRGGGNFTRHFFQPGALSVDLQQPGQNLSSLDSLERLFLDNEQRFAIENELYLETDWRFWRGFQLMAGANASRFSIDKTDYLALQPRVHLQKNFRRGWSTWLGYHRMTQNLHQIGSFNISLPFELWVPSTKKVEPEEVWQSTVGVGLNRRHWSVQVEGYYKKLNRVLTFLSAFDALYAGGAENASGWEDRIAAGQGWSRGAEVFFEKKTGNFRGSVGYTMNWAWRKFPDLNSGNAFPFRFDRRHDLKILIQQNFNAQWSADATWVFATGNPITLTGVKFQHTSNDAPTSRTVLVYSEINGYRLTNYHRLDLGLTWTKAARKTTHQVQFGIYNVYNRANPFFLAVDASSSVRGKAIQYTLLPVLPSFRYEIEF